MTKTRNEWIEEGREAMRDVSMLHWKIGDWLVYGEGMAEEWGDTYKLAQEVTGMSYASLSSHARAAKAFPPSTNRFMASFSHYQVALLITEEKRMSALAAAKEEKLTRDAFRAFVKRPTRQPKWPSQSQQNNRAGHEAVCPNCSHSFICYG